jgi:lipid A 4'-phosphatase
MSYSSYHNSMTLVRQSSYLWWFPLLITLIILPFTPWIDMAIEQHFFSTGKDPITHFHESPLLDFIFTYGPLPSEIISIGALFFIPFARYRNQALVLVMTMVIGSGLIAHLLLKEFWGRPRPRQVIELGGAQPYRPVWQPNFHPQEPSKSFVCGHCTMGFYFFAFVLLGRRYQKKSWIVLGWILSLTLGLALAITRMMQGGHFFSDVFFAAIVMWYGALLSDWLVYAPYEAHETPH